MIYKNQETGTEYVDISSLPVFSNGRTRHVISLFSGAGGLDIGLEQAGFSTAVAVENDIDCRETLRFNRPEWKLFEKSTWEENGVQKQREPGDIRMIDSSEILELANLKKGQTDLVVGGAPCQPFSNIGKKQGKDDEKNGDLFLEFVRIVKGVQPRGFIFENVAGITQGKHSEVLTYMYNQFEGEGYSISYAILNAADYGVPQTRERFFLIGLKGSRKPAFPLPSHFRSKILWEKFSRKLDQKPSYLPKNWVSVKKAFSKIPTNSNNRSDYALMNVSQKVIDRMRLIKQDENFKVLPMDMRPNCWKNGKHQGQDTFGRLNENQPSVTIRTAAYNPSKGKYIHPNENRGLSTIEMAALQDFPKKWIFKCLKREKITLVSGGRQIGNAVPPGLAKALAIALRHQIENTTKESQKKHLEPSAMN